MKNMTLQLSFLMSLILMLLSSSCSKEVERWSDEQQGTQYDSVSLLPSPRILSFKVINADATDLYAAINDSAKTITLYLPAFHMLSFLEVEIQLPEGTAISPKQEELLPVFSDRPFQYSLKDKDGKTAVYTVDIHIQQEDFILNELSTAEKTLKISKSGDIQVFGKNFIPDLAVSKGYLVDHEGTVIYTLKTQMLTPLSTELSWWLHASEDTSLKPNTDYWVKIVSYSLSHTMKYPIQIY